jgi:hypothetical protein
MAQTGAVGRVDGHRWDIYSDACDVWRENNALAGSMGSVTLFALALPEIFYHLSPLTLCATTHPLPSSQRIHTHTHTLALYETVSIDLCFCLSTASVWFRGIPTCHYPHREAQQKAVSGVEMSVCVFRPSDDRIR